MDNRKDFASISKPTEEVQDDLQAFRNPNYEECQEIRDKYWEMSEKLKILSDKNGEGGCSADKLIVEIAHLNEIFNKVKRANEGRIDARILKQINLLAKVNIEKTQTCLLSFKPSEYAKFVEKFSDNGEPLSEIFEENSTTLNAMSKAMSCLYRSTYGLEPLYGALDWEPPEKPQRNIQKRKEDANQILVKKTLHKVENANTNEENEMVEVTRIYKILCRRFVENQNEPLDFLRFVIDPKCFSTTVQNMFHTSFLIRDKKAKFSFDKYKIPYISPVVEGKKGGSIHKESSHQSIIEMNIDLWKEAISVLEIKEPLIPPLVKSSNKRSSQTFRE